MIRWTYALIDRPTAAAGRARAFWTEVTGTHESVPQGERAEFTTLLPDEADACLAVQAVGGAGGAHPDLAVEDMPAVHRAGHRARSSGGGTEAGTDRAALPRRSAVLSRPLARTEGPPAGPRGPRGSRVRLDQLCLDVAPAAFDSEVAFWAALTGWESTPGDHEEFHVLRPHLDLPVHLLLQRLDEARPASAHLDIACPDLDGGQAWHERCGATLVRKGPAWTVMRDPRAASTASRGATR